MFGGSKRDKGFSSKNKVQQYHGDGIETIIVMGKPFRVLQKLSDLSAPYMAGNARRRIKHQENTHASYVFLVENSSRLTEFPRHLALKRSFYPVDQVQEAHKEIEIMSRIKDKNIVRTYHCEVSRSEGKLGVSIAMEYCGNNLYRRIRSGASGGAGTRLSESEICHVLLAVTSALGYLHSQQPPIAHRDIRPENILINNNQTGAAAYKLCNFSSASTDAYQCETREEASMAINDIEFHTNPAFRSPEMADPWSKKRICEKSDMWSLGVLLYFMMYLRLPFEATNMALSNNPQVRYPAADANRYCGSLRTIVDRLLDPNPDSRWDVFALTNFLRFDDDVSKHLGTFCFTRTEYPEGWEEQDVKVMNRDAPPKAPPVTYGGEAGHHHVNDDRRAVAERQAAVAAGNGAADPSPTNRSNNGNGNGNGNGAGNDDAVRQAMMVLGGADDDDPEMAQYRAMIIKEQEEAWAQLKRNTGGSSGGESQPQASSSGDNASPTSQAAAAEAPPAPPKKDLFDDLFSGPAEPQQQPQQQQQQPGIPAQAASTSASPNPPQPQKDNFSADDLFAAPAPPPQQQQFAPYQQPQQQGWGGDAGNQNYGGGWSTGMPAPMGGGPMPPQQQQQFSPYQQQQPQGWGGGAAAPASAGYGSGYGSSSMGGAGSNYSPPSQAPPMSQANYDFMAPAPGQMPPPQQQQQQTAAPPQTTVPAKKKDPFADLFS